MWLSVLARDREREREREREGERERERGERGDGWEMGGPGGGQSLEIWYKKKPTCFHIFQKKMNCFRFSLFQF